MGALSSGRYIAIRNNNSRRTSYIGTAASTALFVSTTRLVTTSSRTGEFVHEIYANGVLANSNSISSDSLSPNNNMFILGLSSNGTIAAPFAGEIDFAAAHKGLSANQAQDLYDAITTYNTAVR